MNKVLVIAGGVIRELIRRKDFYLIFALLVIIVLYSATISFGGETGFSRYFKEIGISLVYIFSVIIAVTFAARQIPQEMETKTIYSILAHPLSRWQFLIGKFFGVFIVAAVSLSLFYVFFLASIWLKGDFSTSPALFAEGYFLHLCLLSIFTSLTIFLSLFLSVSANTGISLILYFASNWLGTTVRGYIFLPHPELFDIKEKIVHTWDVIPFWVISFLFAYAVIYTAIFLSSAYMVFRRRNL